MLLTLSSIGKRVREIGTLKALGWTQRRVVRQVVGETLAQGVAGGVIGVVLGVLAENRIGRLLLQAALVRANGLFQGPKLVALGPEGPTWVIATPVDIKAGQTQDVVVRFTLPQASGQVQVMPTARLTPVTWHYRGTTETDATPFILSW